MKVLLTGAKHAEAFKVLPLLKTQQVVLADYDPVPKLQLAKYSIYSLGNFQETTLPHQLLKSCMDVGASCLIPLLTEEVLAANASSVLFKEYGIRLLTRKSEASNGTQLLHTEENALTVWSKGCLMFSSAPLDAAWEKQGEKENLNGFFSVMLLDDACRYTPL